MEPFNRISDFIPSRQLNPDQWKNAYIATGIQLIIICGKDNYHLLSRNEPPLNVHPKTALTDSENWYSISRTPGDIKDTITLLTDLEKIGTGNTKDYEKQPLPLRNKNAHCKAGSFHISDESAEAWNID